MTQGTVVRHDIHGGLFHNTCIFICEYIAIENKFKILDGDAWRHKTISPGVPDLVFEYVIKIKVDGKTTPIKKLAVVEIDTRGSKESEKKKWEQFVRDNPGYELYYINMKELHDMKDLYDIEWSVDVLYKWLKVRLPA